MTAGPKTNTVWQGCEVLLSPLSNEDYFGILGRNRSFSEETKFVSICLKQKTSGEGR